MSVLGLIIILFLLGLLCWVVYRFAPIPAGFKTLIYFVLMAIAILLVLQAFGLLGSLNMQVPHVR
jgi:hypothetical protein